MLTPTRCQHALAAVVEREGILRKILVLVLAMTMVLTVAAPSGAKVKEREANGVTSFMLNPTCDPTPGAEFGACPFADGILALGLSNPGVKVGTFKGSQLFEGTLFITVENGSFTMTGTVVFEGRVKACGHGTVEFEVDGSGFLTPGVGGGANFITNTQKIVGGSLPIEGALSELGVGTGNEDGTAGTLDYAGDYSCDQRGRGHS